MPIIVSKIWTSLFSMGRANAITIFPFILLRSEKLRHDRVLINHERIHLAQALELLIVPFYLFYLLEFGVRLLQYRDFQRAYRNISFEREAFFWEHDLSYLGRRKRWNFRRYLVKKAY